MVTTTLEVLPKKSDAFGFNTAPTQTVNTVQVDPSMYPQGNTAPAPTTAPTVAQSMGTPEPTIGQTLEGIKTKAMSIQDELNKRKTLESLTYDTNKNPYEDAIKPIDEKAIQRNQMKLFQSEIDATNKVYDDMLNQERLAGQGRLGTQTAMSARGGLLGSDFGEANRQNQITLNTGAEQAVQNERMAKIGGIMGTMRKAVADEIANKRLARTQDAETYVKYLASSKERKQANVQLAATALLDSGLDPTTMTPQELEAIGKEANLSANDILMEYRQMKATKDAETAKTDLETRKTEAEISKIEADIASGKLVSLGEGTMLYNIETGEKIKNPKTATPGTGGGGGSSSSGGYASDLDALIGSTTLLIPSKFGQENFNKQIASARNPQDKLNLVASQVLRGQSADLRNDFTNLKTGVSQLDKAIGLIDSGVQTGLLESGAQYAFNAFGQDFDPKLAELRSNIVAAVQPYRNSVTGAAWGSQEESEYQALFGSNKYAPEELKLRLNTMKEIMIDKQASALNSMVNPLDYYDNQFSNDYQGGDDLSTMSLEDLERIANGG